MLCYFKRVSYQTDNGIRHPAFGLEKAGVKEANANGSVSHSVQIVKCYECYVRHNFFLAKLNYFMTELFSWKFLLPNSDKSPWFACFPIKSDYHLKWNCPLSLDMHYMKITLLNLFRLVQNYKFEERLFCFSAYAWVLCFIIKEWKYNRSKKC